MLAAAHVPGRNAQPQIGPCLAPVASLARTPEDTRRSARRSMSTEVQNSFSPFADWTTSCSWTDSTIIPGDESFEDGDIFASDTLTLEVGMVPTRFSTLSLNLERPAVGKSQLDSPPAQAPSSPGAVRFDPLSLDDTIATCTPDENVLSWAADLSMGAAHMHMDSPRVLYDTIKPSRASSRGAKGNAISYKSLLAKLPPLEEVTPDVLVSNFLRDELRSLLKRNGVSYHKPGKDNLMKSKMEMNSTT